ncbi:unnamed protein product [Cuscuta campestris]|uniref:Phosphatidylinositol 4-phosphate 5-kinase n=1 Tax=Cuscuta campestris TaxID=132261 RepID=A0A484KK77_9ASTE|nr:unnamed protein product [Cuscuta campestris]
MREISVSFCADDVAKKTGLRAKGGEEDVDVVILPPFAAAEQESAFTGTASERVLPNGDLYTGTFVGNRPHGNGKYLWSDGCMYEGQWRRGTASGKGKFSWPSGATYEGEFRAGSMEGQGTFIGADGDTYRGRWLADRKHGFGEKRYANGDLYVGSWRCNLQDGEGRYVWSNGNEYVGEWKNGVMSGKGVLIWANGKRYEGDWEDGNPKGNGVFTWPDGRISYAAGDNSSSCQEFSSSCHGRRGSSVSWTNASDRNLNVPRICIWESEGEAGDITCDIVDPVEASSVLYIQRNEDEGSSESSEGDYSLELRKSPCRSEGVEMKKPGQIISKGHKNYDLVVSLQLGIRYSVEKHGPIGRELRSSDFDPYEKFWTRFPPEGSKCTPVHHAPDFKWKDYCPVVFKRLRDLFGIDSTDYVAALCSNDALREMSSPGKSGSIFYLTQDDRFIIKTVKKSEVKVLVRMLPSYYKHVTQYKNSLVTRFFGAHCVKPVGCPKTRFIVMGNMFYSKYRIHRRFDVKGSSYGRSTDKPEGHVDETTTLKDLDLNLVFHLQRSRFEELISQINRDCQFLEAENIMDYSLLIGVHFCNNSSSNGTSGGLSPDDCFEMRDAREYSVLDSMLLEELIVDTEQKALGSNLPARASHTSRINHDTNMTGCKTCAQHGTTNKETSSSSSSNVLLYLGIIDILQDYDISKKLEHAYKSFQVDSTSISAVDPKLYSKRFRYFINSIFSEEGDEDSSSPFIIINNGNGGNDKTC